MPATKSEATSNSVRELQKIIRNAPLADLNEALFREIVVSEQHDAALQDAARNSGCPYLPKDGTAGGETDDTTEGSPIEDTTTPFYHLKALIIRLRENNEARAPVVENVVYGLTGRDITAESLDTVEELTGVSAGQPLSERGRDSSAALRAKAAAKRRHS